MERQLEIRRITKFVRVCFVVEVVRVAWHGGQISYTVAN